MTIIYGLHRNRTTIYLQNKIKERNIRAENAGTIKTLVMSIVIVALKSATA